MLGGWILLQFVNEVGSIGQPTAETGGVAYAAHIGGFLTGVILILAFKAAGLLRTPESGEPPSGGTHRFGDQTGRYAGE
jgi:membrane associated rhomboid family serine protease